MKGYASRFHSADVAASLSIIVARIFYAVNWFNVAAIFPLIALDFEQDISLLGSISAAFFIGVGIFQIPAGIFAAKYSPRTSAIFGIALSSTAALVYGFAYDASQLVWLRFIVGAGMAFFFSSAIVLIARYAGAKSSGFSIGLMNSAHSIGGIVGIFAWIVIAQMVGWRPSLILAGAIGIATAILMIVAIPHEDRQPKTLTHGKAAVDNAASIPKRAIQGEGRWLKISEVWKILSSRQLIAIGLVLTGVQAAWALTVTFIVVYLRSLDVSLEITGIIASLGLISAIVSAPLIGRLYDRTVKDARKILLVCGVGIGSSLAGISLPVLPVIIAAVIAIEFFAGGAFTVAFAKARTTRTIDSNDVSYKDRPLEPEDNKKSNDKNVSHGAALNVAWINGLSLVGILWMPLAFSIAVKSEGYGSAWLLSAIIASLFMFLPLQKVRK